MGSDLKGRKIKPHPSSPAGMRIDCIATETIAKNQIVYVDTTSTATDVPSTALGLPVKQKVGVATNATKLKSHGELYIALNGGTVGQRIVCSPVGLLKNLNTGAAAKGDPVYLSTAGAPTLTPTGYQRKIGTVLLVGAVGTGVVSFTPGQISALAKSPVIGTAAVSAAASVTVLAATLGGSFGGAPAFAVCSTVSGVIHVTACTWSTNDLVITLSASYTGNVNYQVWV